MLLISIIIFILQNNFQILLKTRIELNPVWKRAEKAKFDTNLVKNEEKAKFPLDFSLLGWLKVTDNEPPLYLDKGNQNRSVSNQSSVTDRGEKIEKRLIVKSKEVLTLSLLSVKNQLFLGWNYLLQWRKIFLEHLEEAFSPRDASLVKGLLLGDASSVSQDLYHSFKVIGILHILSASAQNLNVLLSMFTLILRPWRRFLEKKYLLSLYLILLLVYSNFTQLPVSVLRATLSIFLAIMATQQFFFLPNSLHIFFLVAIFLLLINPFYLESLGFQLSFLATFGILYLNPRLTELFLPEQTATKRGWNILKKYLITSIILSFSAQFFLWPVFALNFSEVNFSSFISNIFILPLMDSLLLLLFVYALCSALSLCGATTLFDPLSQVLVTLIHHFIDIILYCINLLLKICQNFDLEITEKSFILPFFCCLYLLTFALFGRLKRQQLKKYQYRIIK